MNRLLIPCLLWLCISTPVAAETYQTSEAFLHAAFPGSVPQPALLWLTGELRKKVETILDHPATQLRLRYWRESQRSAWILEEIGKEKPITVGIVVDAGRIERVRVLRFRESRGWEVRHAFFTDQFKQAGLSDTLKLDKPIDGISGATLSVRALTNLTRLALYLDQQLPETAHVSP